MIKTLKDIGSRTQTRFSFGTTSAIITNLGLIIGLDGLIHPKSVIIGGILIIGLADNISDSFGIHIYQESEMVSNQRNWRSTLSNFLARLVVSLTFLLIVVVFPIKVAVLVSVAWGLLLLSLLSYKIAKAKKVRPYLVIREHLIIALLVIILSNYLGKFLEGRF